MYSFVIPTGTSYLKLPDDDEENVLVLNEEVTSTRFKDLKNVKNKKIILTIF